MDGILVIDKPKQYTSHDIVKKVKKIVNTKVGHTGTLDPNATGVLPLLIGKGTELSKYLINHDKTYEAVLQLGEKRDTGDCEGKVIEKQEVPESCLKKENIKKVFNEMIGKQEQIPPIYSAIKINGKKLYEYARKGENVEIPSRQIEIYSLELIDIHNNEIKYRVKCSKGTYIRTLCEDIATRLGTIGYMKELRRTQVGEFELKDSIKIEELENSLNEAVNLKIDSKMSIDNGTSIDSQKLINDKIITIEKYFEKNNFVNLDENTLKMYLNGVKLKWNLEDGIYRIYNNEKFIGIGVISNGFLKRDIVI